MADSPQPDRPPSTIPPPDYELIRRGGPVGQIELADAIKRIVDAFNDYVIRKG